LFFLLFIHIFSMPEKVFNYYVILMPVRGYL